MFSHTFIALGPRVTLNTFSDSLWVPSDLDRPDVFYELALRAKRGVFLCKCLGFAFHIFSFVFVLSCLYCFVFSYIEIRKLTVTVVLFTFLRILRVSMWLKIVFLNTSFENSSFFLRILSGIEGMIILFDKSKEKNVNLATLKVKSHKCKISYWPLISGYICTGT